MTKDPRSIKILIIEDNRGDFVLVEEYLHEQFDLPELVHAPTWREALSILKESKASFDLVLLDLSLPDKNGEPLLDAMLENSGSIPVIVLTGYSDLNFSVRSLSKGVSDYLLKDDLSPALLHKSIIYSIERSQFSAAIKKSEENYRKLFEFSPSPMWVYDAETLEFLDVNEAAIKHYGYSKEEFLNMSIREIRPPDAREELDYGLELAQENPEIRRFGVYRHQKKNGEIILVEIEQSTLELDGREARLILSDDITEKLKEEERLKLLESVITNSTEAVIILEPVISKEPGRRILYVNNAFSEITGYSKKEVLGETVHFMNGTETDKRHFRKFVRKWRGGKSVMLS
jgi:PAS domain S-box-containing protein